MSAGAGLRRRSDEGRWPLLKSPEEGWLTALLVFLLVLPIAWSIEDARWVLGRRELTDFLPWAVVGGAAWGMAGAKVGWGRWRTHAIGAVMAALVVPILVGSILEPSGGIAGWFLATSDSTVEAILDLTVRNRSVTQQYGHFLLVLGLLGWATGQFAGFATLGHRRPLGAVFITGLVLLANMSVTIRPQLPFLVVFSIASLSLLVRLHADEERLGWLRRRIGDPAAVTSLYLRGGSAFVITAVIGSLFLTNAAASAPLAGAFRSLDQQLIEVGQSLQRYLPFGGPGTRLSGDAFGPTATISGRWVTDPTPTLRIILPPGDDHTYYWRAYAYDRFTGTGWSVSENAREDRAAGQSILDGTGDQVPDPTVRHPLSFTVQSLGYSGSALFLPDAAGSVSLDTQVTLVGAQHEFGGIEARGSWDSYRATSLVPTRGGEAFTANQLRAAGNTYPADVRRLYTVVPPNAIGPNAQKLLERIRKAAGSGNPYDLAATAERILRSNDFQWDNDVSDLDCESLSTVECFATYKRGHCQYYATTMAILLRSAGVPTRLAMGYLPGSRDPHSNVETILKSNSHAWVEVYFPRFGWYSFDPTGGNLTELSPLPAGRPVPTPSASPRASGDTDTAPDPFQRRPDTGAGSTSGSTPSGPGSAPFIFLAILLVIAVGGAAIAAYWRGPRKAAPPDAVWSGVARLAGRFGWAPRPTQTPYEYAYALGEVLPIARPELQVVAAAKVEVAYGRRILDDNRLATLRSAHRRLRLLLLRLAFRRPGIRGRRGTAR